MMYERRDLSLCLFLSQRLLSSNSNLRFFHSLVLLFRVTDVILTNNTAKCFFDGVEKIYYYSDTYTVR